MNDECYTVKMEVAGASGCWYLPTKWHGPKSEETVLPELMNWPSIVFAEIFMKRQTKHDSQEALSLFE
jgi:hypothetical protein